MGQSTFTPTISGAAAALFTLIFSGNLIGQGLDSIVRAMASERDRFSATEPYKKDTLAEKPLGLIYERPVEARYITSDVANNAFIISEKNEVMTFSDRGEPLATYSNDRLGPAARIDCSNASATLVWYPDFHTAVWLDASLTELARLDLRTCGLADVKHLAAGSDRTLWAYDEANFQLKNIDQRGKTLYSSQNISQILGKAPAITGLQEFDGAVYMGDSQEGFHIFDRFGQFQKTVRVTGVGEFSVTDNKMRYFSEGLIHEVFTKNTSFKRATAPPPQVQKGDTVFIQKRRIYVIRPDRFEAWFLGVQ